MQCKNTKIERAKANSLDKIFWCINHEIERNDNVGTKCSDDLRTIQH